MIKYLAFMKCVAVLWFIPYYVLKDNWNKIITLHYGRTDLQSERFENVNQLPVCWQHKKKNYKMYKFQ